ncbi:MAG: Crp/Fnr family transcriptional regulator [Firmicutes bacterium]|nr:Crp/Fnr family transcriptional regulator [Bacillota bacterium]
MNMPEMSEGLEFFRQMGENDAKLLFGKGSEKNFAKGASIIMEGEKSLWFYIVLSGKVKIYKTSEDGREHIFHFARKGDYFGETSMMDGLPSPYSAMAVTSSTVLAVKDTDLKDLMNTSPEICRLFFRNVSGKMRKMLEMIEDLSFKNVPDRLAKILVDMADHEGVKSGKNMILERNLTLYELASMVGTVREVITRSLQKLEKEGYITIARQQIEILDLEGLRKYS